MHGSVVLNFMNRPASEFSLYAAAFWRGGRLLAVRRGKSVLSIAGEKLVIPPKALERHELSSLLEPIRRVFNHMGWISKTNPEGRKLFRDFDALVRNVDRLDAGSYTFRYPVDKKDKGLVSHHFGFNVLEFAQQVEGAIRLLDGAVTGPKKNGTSGHLKLTQSKRPPSVVNGTLLVSNDINTSVPLN